ncbi:MAG TPA: hypothetical protein VKQ89_03070, partial [Candidatus Angelobacter sp.]|nr:hypothetical protein [Candidatus Angelobacter sp.]
SSPSFWTFSPFPFQLTMKFGAAVDSPGDGSGIPVIRDSLAWKRSAARFMRLSSGPCKSILKLLLTRNRPSDACIPAGHGMSDGVRGCWA